MEAIGGQHGIVAIPNYNMVDNVTYTCISRNNLGYDTQHVFQNSLQSKCDAFNWILCPCSITQFIISDTDDNSSGQFIIFSFLFMSISLGSLNKEIKLSGFFI